MALINELTNIGNAIREKTGGTELIPLKEMASAIQGISSGGGTNDSTTALRANSSVEIIEPININNNIVVSSRVVAAANAVIKE